jgi:hypothetical protein
LKVKPVHEDELRKLRLALGPLVGVQLDVLRLPAASLKAFEPSQVGTIVGTLMDACIPELPRILRTGDQRPLDVGLSRHEGCLGEREGYPDYRHKSGLRVELKLLYVDPAGVEMKKPPTPREPSARITQKVTVKNVLPAKDVLLVLAYQLQPAINSASVFCPTVIDVAVFPMIDCVLARDDRLARAGGLWFGNYETPCVPSKVGLTKIAAHRPLNTKTYGRKESEGRDFNEDTNFGKLKRIPYKPLQLFLKKHGAEYAASGEWPERWTI